MPAEEIAVSLPEPVFETAPGDASALAAAIAVAYALSAKPKTVFASDTQSIQTGSTGLPQVARSKSHDSQTEDEAHDHQVEIEGKVYNVTIKDVHSNPVLAEVDGKVYQVFPEAQGPAIIPAASVQPARPPCRCLRLLHLLPAASNPETPTSRCDRVNRCPAW